jgi:hypothetical protein
MQLFYTDGPRAGLEAPFPAPNDATKLRRSVASTHQQGMITYILTSSVVEFELTFAQASLRPGRAVEAPLELFAIALGLYLLCHLQLRSPRLSLPLK